MAEGWGHPQYGNGAEPVIPEFLIAATPTGEVNGFSGDVDLAQQEQLYNVDARAGSLRQLVRANREGTDWYDAVTRTGTLQRHTLGFSGSTETSRYYLGMGAQLQEGILLNNDFQRYSFRINTEFDLGKHIRIR